MAEDLGERTEEATPRRRELARREGNVPRSQELSGALMLLAAVGVTAAAVWPALRRFAAVLEAALGAEAHGHPLDPLSAIAAARHVGAAAAQVALPVLAAMFVAAALSQVLQVGWVFAPKLLAPRMSKLGPAAGLKRIFGTTGLVKATIDTVKVALVLAVAALTVWQYRTRIVGLVWLEPLQSVARAGWMLLDLSLRAAAVLLVLGWVDFLYQRFRHARDLRMTRQQVKDELRESEGDPGVKARRMRMQQQIALQRISAAVPRADVVVTNPEHVSVAIRYDAQRDDAPRVIAKGADLVALRIRQIALSRGIPVVQRPPLARAIYRQVAVGREIPPDLYHAVAEVLAYVYRLGGRVVT
jgi:flagellar biosynthetic protein FlhB